jgi:hypothetical protein
MKHIITCTAIGALSLITTVGALGATTTGQPAARQTPKAQTTTPSPTHAGQPNQSCQTTPTTPGNAATAPGSAFNTAGTAGMVYAGQQPQNSNNPASVSQYDVACAKQPPK